MINIHTMKRVLSSMREHVASGRPGKDVLIPLLIFISSVCVRLLCAYSLYGFNTPEPVFMKYVLNGYELRENGFLPTHTFGYSPIYIYFIALLLTLFQGSIYAIIIAQIIAGALTSVVIYFIGKTVFSRKVGVIAAVFSIISIQFILYDTELLSDSLGMFLQCAALLLIILAARRPGIAFGLAAGVAVGMASLQRPSALLYLVLAVAWFAVERIGQSRTAVRNKVIAVVAGCMIMVSPIVVLNYYGGKDLVPITSAGGYVFYCGNNFQSSGAQYYPPRITISNDTAKIGPYVLRNLNYYDDVAISIGIASKVSQKWLKPSEASKFWFEESLAYIERFPGELLSLMWRKLVFIFHSLEVHDLESLRKKRNLLSNDIWDRIDMVLLPMGLAGFILSLKRRECLVVHMAWGVQVITLLLFYIVMRFKLPLLALGMIYAAFAVSLLDETARDFFLRREGLKNRLLPTVSVVAAVFMFCNWPYGFVEDQRAAQRSVEHLQVALREVQENSDPVLTIRRLREIIDLVPISFEASTAHMLLGGLYKKQGDGERAQYEYAMGQGKHSDIKTLLLRAVEKDQQNARAFQLLGLILLKEGKAEEAADYLRRGLAAEPANFRIRTLYAQALINMGIANYRLAAAELKDAVDLGEKLNEASPLIYFKLSLLHRIMGDQKTAKYYLKKTLFEQEYVSDAQYVMHAILTGNGMNEPLDEYDRGFLNMYKEFPRRSSTVEREIEQRILFSMLGLG